MIDREGILFICFLEVDKIYVFNREIYQLSWVKYSCIKCNAHISAVLMLYGYQY